MRTGTGRTNSWELAFTLLDKLVSINTYGGYGLGISIHPS